MPQSKLSQLETPELMLSAAASWQMLIISGGIFSVNPLYRARVPALTLTVTVAQIFKDTIAPASMVGLSNAACAVLFSGYVGDIVDKTGRLKFVRSAIATQKVCALTI
jgi:hypothetical protein